MLWRGEWDLTVLYSLLVINICTNIKDINSTLTGYLVCLVHNSVKKKVETRRNNENFLGLKW